MIVLAVAIVAATVIVINSSSKLFIVFYLKKGLGQCGLIEVAYQNCVLWVYSVLWFASLYSSNSDSN